MTFDEFKAELELLYDCNPEELLDLLEINVSDITDAFEDRVMVQYMEKLISEDDEYEWGD